MNAKQLLEYIINPVLKELGFDEGNRYNTAMLLLYTCHQESLMGKYIVQIGGPALGIMQMEPDTHDDIVMHFIKYRDEVRKKVLNASGVNPRLGEAGSLVFNLRYAVAMARIQYRRSPLKIPSRHDFEGCWQIYKSQYNSHLGAATKEEFRHSFDVVRSQVNL